MFKKVSLFLALPLAIMLVGCEDETTKVIIDDNEKDKNVTVKEDVSNEENYVAKASDFRMGFINRNANHQIIGLNEEGGIYIIATSTSDFALNHSDENVIRTDIDRVLQAEGIKENEKLEKVYPNAKIETNGSKYTITLEEDLVLEFKKVGQRIIKDSFGKEYFTHAYPE